ncbi:hypothetical protein F4V43_08225 [Paenibacillus spiritus]|uniref:Lipoprotein n=1 Tax=Paenibacillus spiritus TaxID=2496557 RepID=A0A5J5GDC7_9BACL|nr:hypothetical protein [Paenibacillus spiritus]KAA9005444.1 hypothetical protein F4V43_08225 [Paenibacillus spiritus]
MKRIGTRTVTIIVALWTVFSLFGCGLSRERAAERILKGLEAKYGEPFTLDGIGGSWGTMNNHTLKAIVRPKSDPNLKVAVEMTKDGKQLFDKYLNQRVAKNEEPRIRELAQRLWPAASLSVANDTRLTYPKERDISMSFAEFMERYPTNIQLVSIYLDASGHLNGEGRIDSGQELPKYREFAGLLKDQGYYRTSVNWVYLTPEAYLRLGEARASSDTIDQYLMKLEEDTGKPQILAVSGLTLDAGGTIEETEQEILSYFDAWEEQSPGRTE